MLWRKVMQGLSAGPRAVGRHAARRRARARADGVRRGRVLGHRRHASIRARSPRACRPSTGKRVAQGRDFGRDGELACRRPRRSSTEDDARGLADRPRGRGVRASRSVEEKPYTRRPAPPFMTSTLQQEASRKLRLQLAADDARRPAPLRERLHHLHAHRLDDAVRVGAHGRPRRQAAELYGAECGPGEPRRYERRVKNAQEAHEAIRPAGDRFRTPRRGRSGSSPATSSSLYDLIWKRTVASQMADARGQTVSVRIGADAPPTAEAGRVRHGRHGDHVPRLPARLRGGPRRAGRRRPRSKRCRRSRRATSLTATTLEPEGHETSPPARYTEATLVKALEERGIGRPSTYAAIMGTILDRGYVRRSRGRRSCRSSSRSPSSNLLEQHFARLVDYEFTARMEDDLDQIAAGDEARTAWLQRFYFGDDGDAGLKQLVEQPRRHRRPRRSTRSRSRAATSSFASAATARTSSATASARRSRPSIAPDELTPERGRGAARAGPAGARARRRSRDRAADRAAHGPLRPVRHRGVDEGSRRSRARRRCFQSMSPDDLTLDEAVRLLTLPRTLGRGPTASRSSRRTAATAHTSRRGRRPARSSREEQLFTITLDDALDAARAAEARAAARAAAPPLRGAGRRPGQRQADRRQGRPLRPIRHRRRDERQPAGRRHGRGDHAERAAELLQRAPRAGPGQEGPRRPARLDQSKRS